MPETMTPRIICTDLRFPLESAEFQDNKAKLMKLPRLKIEIRDQVDALNLRKTLGDFEPSLVIYGAPCWRISREENKSPGQETDDGFRTIFLDAVASQNPNSVIVFLAAPWTNYSTPVLNGQILMKMQISEPLGYRPQRSLRQGSNQICEAREMVATTITNQVHAVADHLRADGKLNLASLVERCVASGKNVLFIGEGNLTLSRAILSDVAHRHPEEDAPTWHSNPSVINTCSRRPIGRGRGYDYNEFIEWWGDGADAKTGALRAAVEWNNAVKFVRPCNQPSARTPRDAAAETVRLVVIQLLINHGPDFLRWMIRRSKSALTGPVTPLCRGAC